MKDKIKSVKTLNDLVEIVGEILYMDDEKVNKVIDRIRSITKNYVQRNKLKSLVMGVSGGLDSAVVAALSEEKYTGIPLIGLSIPMSSSNAHREQAEWVGNNYCSVFEEFTEWDDTNNGALKDVLDVLEKTDAIAERAGFDVKSFPKNILQGNVKARLRMITLYDLARKTGGLVLSTDNYSEYNVGFWTLCGDVGDFSQIQFLTKGFEVPQLAKALGIRDDIITQPPSDGLGVTDENTDEAQLGADYKTLDTVLMIELGKLEVPDEIKILLKEKLHSIPEQDVVNNLISKHKSTEFKRQGSFFITRDLLFS